jgi:hypothetical protein
VCGDNQLRPVSAAEIDEVACTNKAAQKRGKYVNVRLINYPVRYILEILREISLKVSGLNLIWVL